MCFRYYRKGSVGLEYEIYVNQLPDIMKMLTEAIEDLVNGEKILKDWMLVRNSNEVAEQPQPSTGMLSYY